MPNHTSHAAADNVSILNNPIIQFLLHSKEAFIYIKNQYYAWLGQTTWSRLCFYLLVVVLFFVMFSLKFMVFLTMIFTVILKLRLTDENNKNSDEDESVSKSDKSEYFV